MISVYICKCHSQWYTIPIRRIFYFGEYEYKYI